MMSCIQLTTLQPHCTYAISSQLRNDSSALCIFSPQHLQIPKAPVNLGTISSSYLGLNIHVKPRKVTPIASGCKQFTPVCLFGGKGKSENDAEEKDSPWKSLEKAMSNLRKDSSVEDVLRQQIDEQEFYDGDNGGENTGGGGGSGGNGGADDGFSPDESDDVNLLGTLLEWLQVIIATIGFICMYMLIIDGEQIIAYTKDIIKYLFTGTKSIRLGRLIKKWKKIIKSYRSVPVTKDPNSLLSAIIKTPTWYHRPAKYKGIARRYLSRTSNLG